MWADESAFQVPIYYISLSLLSAVCCVLDSTEDGPT
jgi:hypothetical protein